MKFIEKTIEWISPTMALKREVNRTKLSAFRKVTNSGYSNSGASRRKNSMKGWNSDSKSPQEDIGQNLAVLRER
ncbi:hypothetical protein DES34_12818, partial [Brevibacillus brevis]